MTRSPNVPPQTYSTCIALREMLDLVVVWSEGTMLLSVPGSARMRTMRESRPSSLI